MPPSSSLTSFSRLLTRPSTCLPRQSIRSFSVRSAGLQATKNDNPQREAQDDREKMNTEPNEYAKSGTDAAGAAQENAAFSTNNPKPEDAKEEAGKGNDVNPLNASPANQEISQGTSEVEGGAGKKAGKGGDATGDKYGNSSV